jgi:uncharacterized protein
VKAAGINFEELADENGRSWISTAYYAEALIDELEAPKHTRRHLSIAY